MPQKRASGSRRGVIDMQPTEQELKAKEAKLKKQIESILGSEFVLHLAYSPLKEEGKIRCRHVVFTNMDLAESPFWKVKVLSTTMLNMVQAWFIQFWGAFPMPPHHEDGAESR